MKIFTKSILLALVSIFYIGAAFAQTYTTIYTKGDDAVDAGYAVINKTFDGGVNVTFTRGGIYEMYLRFYNQSQKLVGEFFYEPVVAY